MAKRKKSKAQIEYEKARNTLLRQRNRIYKKTGIKIGIPESIRQQAKRTGEKVTAKMYREATKQLRKQTPNVRQFAEAQVKYKQKVEEIKIEIQIAEEERKRLLPYAEAMIQGFLSQIDTSYEGGEYINDEINNILSGASDAKIIKLAIALQDMKDDGRQITNFEIHYIEYARAYVKDVFEYLRKAKLAKASEMFGIEVNSREAESVDMELQ